MPRTLSGTMIRYFGPRKELFHLAGLHALKTDARDQAESMRDGGFSARIIETTTCYQVWVSHWVRGAGSLGEKYRKLAKLGWVRASQELLRE